MQVLDIGRLVCKIDESDYILKKYSKSFMADMELASKLCQLYSKLGKSGPSRISETCNVPSQQLLDILEAMENPTLGAVDSIFDKFIKTKQAADAGYSIIEDVHVKEILEYGHAEVPLLLILDSTSIYWDNHKSSRTQPRNRSQDIIEPAIAVFRSRKGKSFTKHVVCTR